MNKNKASAREIIDTLGKKNIVAAIIIFIFAITIISVNFGILYNTKRDKIVEESKHNAIESAQKIDAYLVSSIDTIKLTSYKVDSYLKDGAGNDVILTYLEHETDSIISVIDDNYTGLYGYINGEYLDGSGWVPDEDYVATERPWYQKAAASDGEVVLVDPYLDSQTHTIMMTIARLLSDNESVVALDLSLDRLQTITNNIVDNDYDFAMVLDSEGGVVSHSKPSELGKNYLDEKNSLESTITKKIIEKHKYDFTLKYNGTTYIVFAQKIGTGWYSIYVINGTQVFRPLKIILLTSLLTICFILFIILLMIRNITTKHIETNKLNQQLESMSHIYSAMFDINLKENTYTEISNTTERVSDIVKKSGDNASDDMKAVMKQLSSEKSKSEVLEFVDFNTLDKRLENTNTITLEYLNNNDMWCRGRFVVAEKSSAGMLLRVLWMVEIIDEEKRRQDKLQYLSETDQMTGVCNRGYGETKIRSLIKNGQGGMFVLMDVDKFKSINDTYGHNTGDKVLISFAKTLQGAFRANDIIMRLGGDEFAVFVPDVHNKQAGQKIIDRLFTMIDNTKIPELEGKGYVISVGIAFYQHDDKYSFEELYKHADEGTYLSKKHIGNYVSYYGDADTEEK